MLILVKVPMTSILPYVTAMTTSLYFQNAKNEIRNTFAYVLDYSRCYF